MFQSFLSAIYPLNCLGCGTGLVRFENKICLSCLAGFNRINETFLLDSKSPVAQAFWGKSQAEFVIAAYDYVKSENLATLIHFFKYKGKEKLGKEFAKLMWQFVQNSNCFEDVDCVSYVPMHKRKERKRGFNQAEVLANEFAFLLNKRSESLITRKIKTNTQTEKDVFERFENMQDKFELKKNIGEYKHILLIDDVITTGATLSVCINMLKKEHDVKVSVMALAYRDL